MDIYKKPYIDEFFPGEARPGRYPYPKDVFNCFDIFSIFPLDGGAFFFLKDRLGGAVDGRAMLEALRSGRLLGLWTDGGEFDWELRPNRFEERGKTPWEWIVWVNRLYFLLPLAMEYFRTRDERWAREWFGYLDDWICRNPYEQGDCSGGILWCDMQVCWRFLVLVHSIYLLADSAYLDSGKWKKIYAAAELHAQIVQEEAERHLLSGETGGNHFLQKGLVLLYAGILLPEFGEPERYIRTGKEVLKRHLAKQIDEDGGDAEGSPSYSHFIARMYVEAFLLLEKNRVAGIEGLEDGIGRQYAWLCETAAPNGLSLKINDSYALDTRTDFEVVSTVFPLRLPSRRGAELCVKSGFAVLRDNPFAVFIDAMPQREYHQHFGRPNVLAYFGDQPVMVDPGCCNYDRGIKHAWFQMSRTHNAVVIAEIEERFASCDAMLEYMKKHSKLEITEFSQDDNGVSVSVLHTIQDGETDIRWERRVVLRGGQLRIADRVLSREEIHCTQFFHFAPRSLSLSADGTRAVLSLGTREIRIEQETPARRFAFDCHPAVNDANEFTYSPVLLTEARGTLCKFAVVLSEITMPEVSP